MVPLEAQKEVTPDATETTPESLKVAITLGTGSSFCPEPRGNATQGWGCGDGAKNIPSHPFHFTLLQRHECCTVGEAISSQEICGRRTI